MAAAAGQYAGDVLGAVLTNERVLLVDGTWVGTTTAEQVKLDVLHLRDGLVALQPFLTGAQHFLFNQSTIPATA
jgi:hypothetical protein